MSERRLCQCKQEKLEKIQKSKEEVTRTDATVSGTSGHEKRLCECKKDKLKKLREGRASNDPIASATAVVLSGAAAVEAVGAISEPELGGIVEESGKKVEEPEIKVEEPGRKLEAGGPPGASSSKRLCECKLQKLKQLKEGGTSTDGTTSGTLGRTTSGRTSVQLLDDSQQKQEFEAYRKKIKHQKCPVIKLVRDQMTSVGDYEEGIGVGEGGVGAEGVRAEGGGVEGGGVGGGGVGGGGVGGVGGEGVGEEGVGGGAGAGGIGALISGRGVAGGEFSVCNEGGDTSLKDRLWNKRYHILSLLLLLLLLWLTFAYGILLGVTLCNSSSSQKGQCTGCGVSKIQPGFVSRPRKMNIF